MESLIKPILEILEKSALPVFVALLCILFLPDNMATRIQIYSIRNDYQGLLWIILIFSGAKVLTDFIKFITIKTNSAIDFCVEIQKKKKEIKQVELATKMKLSSLNPEERMWLKYCLFHSIQTLSAISTNTTALSLCHKGILTQNYQGHMLDMPFHVDDKVWKYLKENESAFLSDEDKKSERFYQEMVQFKKSVASKSRTL